MLASSCPAVMSRICCRNCSAATFTVDPILRMMLLPALRGATGAVSVSPVRMPTRSKSTPSSSPAICCKALCVPLRSTEPVVMAIVPSAFIFSVLLPGMPREAQKPTAMPRPRFLALGLCQPDSRARRARISWRSAASSSAPIDERSPTRRAFFWRISSGSSPNREAIISICDSTAKVSCGLPGAR
ncbi:hypothetical protein NKDENANG_03954 [Candidatus Entotheonellaceae bacterium PAL068K]